MCGLWCQNPIKCRVLSGKVELWCFKWGSGATLSFSLQNPIFSTAPFFIFRGLSKLDIVAKYYHG